MTLTYLWVALGGAIGSVTRFWLNAVVSARLGEAFPWGTVLVNVCGSFIIGLLGALTLPENRMTVEARAFAIHFLMIGICGGFTTFSAFSLQMLELLQTGDVAPALLYAVGSVGLCLAFVWFGWWLGRV